MRIWVHRAIGIDCRVFQAGLGMIERAPWLPQCWRRVAWGMMGPGASRRPAGLREQIRHVRAEIRKPFVADILSDSTRTAGRSVSAYAQHLRGLIEVTLDGQTPVMSSGLGRPRWRSLMLTTQASTWCRSLARSDTRRRSFRMSFMRGKAVFALVGDNRMLRVGTDVSSRRLRPNCRSNQVVKL